MEPCRPTGPCTRSIEGTTIRVCWADGGTTVADDEHQYFYMPDGSLCHSVDYYEDGTQVWHDPNGVVAATLTVDELDGSQTVTCGGNEYHVDVNTADCQAALDAPECDLGDCEAGL